MMKKLFSFLPFVAAFLVVICSNPALADKYADTISVFKKSETVQPFFNQSYGYAVFPTVGKAGMGIGGSYGTGLVYQGGKVTGETSLIKATFGLQLGGQAFSQMIFSRTNAPTMNSPVVNLSSTPRLRRWPSPPAFRPKRALKAPQPVPAPDRPPANRPKQPTTRGWQHSFTPKAG